MPITITPFDPATQVGPGLTLDLFSDFVGPLSSDTFWKVAITTDAEDIDSGLQQTYFLNNHHVTIQWEVMNALTGFARYAVSAPNAGDTVHVLAQLVQGTTVIDSGSITATFNPTLGLGLQAMVNATSTTGDFTATDRATITGGLTDILNSVTAQIVSGAGTVQKSLGELFSVQTLDQLTLFEVTDGETFDPVSYDNANWYWGVIVRCTTIPDAYGPRLIDNDWRYNDLAVLRVIRGVDLMYRRGIHTSSWLAESPWAFASAFWNITTLDLGPPEITLKVDWAPGVGGRVYLMRFP